MRKIKPYLTGENILVCLFFLISVYVCLIKIFGQTFDRIPGDLIDARFNNYLAEHAYRFFTGKETSFWNAPFFYPEKDVISYSDNFIGQTPFYGLFRVVGFDRETSYQLWMILSVILNYLICFWVFFKLSKNKVASIAGAFIFSLALPFFSQLCHAQTIVRFFIPLAFYSIIRFFQAQHHKYFLYFLLSVVGQFYFSIYLGLLLSVGLFSFIVIYLVFCFKEINFKNIFHKKPLLFYLLYFFITGCLLLVLMKPYYERSLVAKSHDYYDAFKSLPSINSYFFASPDSWFWKPYLANTAIHAPNYWNQYLFPGGITYLAIIILIGYIFYKGLRSVWQSKSQDIKLAFVFLFSLVLTVLLTLRMNHFSLYKYVHKIPGFSAMGDLARIINIELFLFGGIVTYVCCLILTKTNRVWIKYAIMIPVLTLVLIDNHYNPNYLSYSKKESQERYGNIIKKIKSTNHYETFKILAYMPDKKNENDHSVDHLDAMLAAQALGIKSINGYTATCPDNYYEFLVNNNLVGLNTWLHYKNIPLDTTKSILIIR